MPAGGWVGLLVAATTVYVGPLVALDGARPGANCFVDPTGLRFDTEGTFRVSDLGGGNVVAFGAGAARSSRRSAAVLYPPTVVL